MEEQVRFNVLANGDNIITHLRKSKEQYLEHLKRNPNYSIPWEEEDAIYAVQDWYGMMGEFTPEEYEYIEWKTGLTKEQVDNINDF